MNIKNLKVEKDSINSKDSYKLNKSIVIAGIIIAGLVLGQGAIDNNRNINQPEPSQVTQIETEQEVRKEDAIRIDIVPTNTEGIEKKSKIIIIDSNNVIAAYLEVYPNGDVNDEEILLHPDEDYQAILKYNGEDQVISFHTAKTNESKYKMSIDYDTRTLEVSREENVKTY